MTNEYKNFIKKKKKEKRNIIIIQFLITFLFILLWELLARKNIINSFITSSPSNIIKTLINLYNQNNLFVHILITIKEIIISFIITSTTSLLISTLLYNYKTISIIVDPYLTILNSLPKVALGPLIIICFGANAKSIIIMAILISIIISIQNIYNGFKNTDKNKIKLLKTLNGTKKDILFKLVLPSNKNTILNTLKINISMCTIGVIQGELLTSKAGIGYLITYGTQVFNLDLVMSSIIILTIVSYILYLIITKIKI